MKIVDYRVEDNVYANLDKDWRYGKVHVPEFHIITVSLKAADGTIGEGCMPVLGHFGKTAAEFAAEVSHLSARTCGLQASEWMQSAQGLKEYGAGPSISAVRHGIA